MGNPRLRTLSNLHSRSTHHFAGLCSHVSNPRAVAASSILPLSRIFVSKDGICQPVAVTGYLVTDRERDPCGLHRGD